MRTLRLLPLLLILLPCLSGCGDDAVPSGEVAPLSESEAGALYYFAPDLGVFYAMDAASETLYKLDMESCEWFEGA